MFLTTEDISLISPNIIVPTSLTSVLYLSRGTKLLFDLGESGEYYSVCRNLPFSPHSCWQNVLISWLAHLHRHEGGGGGHHQPGADGPGVGDVGDQGLEAAVVLQVVTGGLRGGGGEVLDVTVRGRGSPGVIVGKARLVLRTAGGGGGGPLRARWWSQVGELLA